MSQERFSPMIESNRLGGVIDDKAKLDALIVALTNAGYEGEDIIRVHHGQADLEAIDPEGIYHGGRIRFIRRLQNLTGGTDQKALEVVQRALSEGKYMVSVLTDGSDEQREQGHQMFKAHGAHYLFFKGSGYMEFLP